MMLSLIWDHEGRLFAGAIETALAEVKPFGGTGSARLPEYVALIHLPGARKPNGGTEVQVREEVETIVRRWLRSATA